MRLRTAVTVLCVMFGAVVLFNAFYVFPKISSQVQANARTTVAVCELRADLERRVDSSVKFLAAHPHGIPGISAKDIRLGIVNQQRTISALRGLDCK